MISTNIILTKKHTRIHIKTKEEIECIKTYCSIEHTVYKTTIKNSFKCDKNISLFKYREKLNSEVIPMLRDFEILMQGV
jgi:hypothetical protein